MNSEFDRAKPFSYTGSGCGSGYLHGLQFGYPNLIKIYSESTVHCSGLAECPCTVQSRIIIALRKNLIQRENRFVVDGCQLNQGREIYWCRMRSDSYWSHPVLFFLFFRPPIFPRLMRSLLSSWQLNFLNEQNKILEISTVSPAGQRNSGDARSWDGCTQQKFKRLIDEEISHLSFAVK